MKPPLAALLLLASLSACSPSSGGTPAFGAGTLPDDFAVFFSERATPGRLESFVVDLQTQEVRSLMGALPVGATLLYENKALSPDGRILAVPFEHDSVTRYALIAVTDGSTHVLPLSDGLNRAGIPKFIFSPDSKKVLFNHESSTTETNHLTLSNVDGSQAVRIGEPGEYVHVSGWTPDSSAIITTVGYYDSAGEPRTELRIYEGNGHGHVELPPVLPGKPWTRDVSKNGLVVAFSIRHTDNQNAPFYRVGAVNRTTGNAVEFPTSDIAEFSVRLSHDGSLVAFVGRDALGNDSQVYVGDTVTGTSSLVSQTTTNPAIHIGADIQWEPGGTRLLYRVDANSGSDAELYISTGSSGAIPLNPSLPNGSKVKDFAWSPNGGYIALLLDMPGPTKTALYLYDANDGGTPALISDPTRSEEVLGLFWAPDGEWLYTEEIPAGLLTASVHAYSVPSGFTLFRELGESFANMSDQAPRPLDYAAFACLPSEQGAVWKRSSVSNGQELVFGRPDDPASIRVVSPGTLPGDLDQIQGVMVR